MLIIPISAKVGWKNPPIVTLTLIILNCLVFFLFQAHDHDHRVNADRFYLTSGLAEIEIPRYHQYLRTIGTTAVKDIPGEFDDEDRNTALMKLHFQLEADYFFLERLSDDRVIHPDEADYAEWKKLRKQYETLRDKSVSFSSGLRPAYPRVSAFFTYMFLHGGFGHLFGNMMFLWILGCMIELGTTRFFFTGTYLLSGVIAALVFWGAYPLSTIPLVGASGAIAGLMGAFTVLYGNKKVAVFYSFGFYFDTAYISAITLFPLWLLNECYQLFLTGEPHVAYIAHIGGLVSGAAFAAVGKRIKGQVKEERFETPVEEKVMHLLADVMDHMADLNMNAAKSRISEILAISPDHPDALRHLFSIHKLKPETPAFHAITRRLLEIYLRKHETYPAAINIFETYKAAIRSPFLPVPLYLQLANAMIAEKEMDKAEKIVETLLKKKPDAPGLPATMIKLSNAFHKNGQEDKRQEYQLKICEQYPGSPEAAILRSTMPVI